MVIHQNNMEEIFIQVLETRSHAEADLLDRLPKDIKALVEEKLITEVIADSQLAE